MRTLISVIVLLAGCFPRLRRDAQANLRIAFGPSIGTLYIRSIMRFADNIHSVIRACAKKGGRGMKMRFDRSKAADIALPWVCVTGHFGAFELQARWAEELKAPIRVVVRPPRNWFFRQLMAFVRRRLCAETILKTNVMRECRQALESGVSVAILADHNAGYNGRFVPFLGFAASTTRLPAVLALRFQRPIVMAFIRRDGDELVAWLEHVILPNPDAPPEDEEKRILTEMNDTFTRVIRRHPEEWFWFHRRWKTRPGDREAHIIR